MPGRRSFKTDESFLEKLAIGAIPSHCRKSGIRNLEFEIKRSAVLDICFGSIASNLRHQTRAC